MINIEAYRLTAFPVNVFALSLVSVTMYQKICSFLQHRNYDGHSFTFNTTIAYRLTSVYVYAMSEWSG